MKKLLIVIAVTLSSSLAMGETLNGVGPMNIEYGVFSVENYVSYSKQTPLQCKGVEGQLILKGYTGSGHSRKWVYKVVGSETPYIAKAHSLKECKLVAHNANQLIEQAYGERCDLAIGVAKKLGVILGSILMLCLFGYLRDRFKRRRRYADFRT